MALDITALQAWVRYNPQILTQKVYQDTFFNKVPITVYPNMKNGTFRTRLFKPAANLANCCTIPTGTSAVTEFDIPAECILDGSEYCETDLAQMITNIETRFRFTAGQENATPIEQVITEGQIAAFTEAIDTLIFQGDTTSTNVNLNKYDGLIKQITNATDSIKQTVATGTTPTVLEVIQKAIMALPPAARSFGKIGVLVGKDVYDAYCLALINKNLYHVAPFMSAPQGQEREEAVLGFSDTVLIPTRGLTGTMEIIVCPLANIIALVSDKEDVNTISWGYNEYQQKYFWRIKTILGIGIAMTSWCVLSTINASVLTNLCPSCQ